MSRSRSWCFTWNNPYPDEAVEQFAGLLEDKKAKYYVFGYEVGASGTPHIQGYIDFESAKTLSSLKKNYGDKIHWETRKGTWEQATDYCKKDSNFKEWGIPAKGRGKRSDIDKVREIVKEGGNMTDVIETVSSYQACKFAELAMKYRKIPMKWLDKKVYWFWGPSGTGKTRTAIEEAGELVWRNNSGSLKWFDGYDNQEHVIFDDFRSSWSTFSYLLNLLDGYPVNVEIKGGHRLFAPKCIWITCPTKPEDTYRLDHCNDRDGQVLQLIRRITLVRYFPAEGEPPEF